MLQLAPCLSVDVGVWWRYRSSLRYLLGTSVRSLSRSRNSASRCGLAAAWWYNACSEGPAVASDFCSGTSACRFGKKSIFSFMLWMPQVGTACQTSWRDPAVAAFSQQIFGSPDSSQYSFCWRRGRRAQGQCAGHRRVCTRLSDCCSVVLCGRAYRVSSTVVRNNNNPIWQRSVFFRNDALAPRGASTPLRRVNRALSH